jgi:hypothetical protein
MARQKSERGKSGTRVRRLKGKNVGEIALSTGSTWKDVTILEESPEPPNADRVAMAAEGESSRLRRTEKGKQWSVRIT